MVKVIIRLFSQLAGQAARREIELDLSEPTLGAALAALDQATAGRITEQLFQERDCRLLNKTNLFVVDGTEARFRAGIQTILKEGSVICIIPPIVGGSFGGGCQ